MFYGWVVDLITISLVGALQFLRALIAVKNTWIFVLIIINS